MAPMHKPAMRELFDGLALEYVEKRDVQGTFIAQKQVVLSMLEGCRGRLLDVGCGPAVMTRDLLERGFEVVGIDLSLEMLRHGVRRVAGHPRARRCRLELGDIERLRFPDESFDVVLCMGVLEYLPDYGRAISEIRRVLRIGGVAVVSLPNRLAAQHLARAALTAAKRLAGRHVPFVPNRCVPRLLVGQFRRAGLDVRDARHCGAQFLLSVTRRRA
jgi:ubiquinone/menaquinone biosynthesis C-methylase UbiE